MRWVIPLHEIGDSDRRKVGGKCYALSVMSRSELNVPDTVCVTTDAYDEYIASTGLRERILLELHRKNFGDMRWEEIWDASLRIRNMFLRKPLSPTLHEHLRERLDFLYKDKSVVVRSSAPGEDAPGTSFAGLHDSYVNVRGTASILDHIKLVWASLWSDAALLYRRELGLDVDTSSMAVVIQGIVVGDRSGVTFTRNPNDQSQGVIESVYGLNQGLVDGTVEPDRWIVDRATHEIVSHRASERSHYVVTGMEKVILEILPRDMAARPPLNSDEVEKVFQTALRSESLFKVPQDMEWTYRNDMLVVLQSRPITTLSEDRTENLRGWYLSLRRSFENLKALRVKIENELIPAMIQEAERLAGRDPGTYSDEELAGEMEQRTESYEKWVDIYWAEFIPFAHGVRLFGQVYNNAVRPEDPYEFVDLLRNTNMASLERNRLLDDLAAEVRRDPSLGKKLRDHQYSRMDRRFIDTLKEFSRRFSDISQSIAVEYEGKEVPDGLVKIILELTEHPRRTIRSEARNIKALRDSFLNRFDGAEKEEIRELLDLARTSYRMRDDDNIYLGRIEREMGAAVNEGKRRLAERGFTHVDQMEAGDIMRSLTDRKYIPSFRKEEKPQQGHFAAKARQLIGQPAGPGVARGPARVIATPSDLTEFKHGEILVCDAVDPNMTFVIPLAAAVVERRGGMLIHGAIIAREYGLACVTGVPKATAFIQTGDTVTVDGYLGIVTVG